MVSGPGIPNNYLWTTLLYELVRFSRSILAVQWKGQMGGDRGGKNNWIKHQSLGLISFDDGFGITAKQVE